MPSKKKTKPSLAHIKTALLDVDKVTRSGRIYPRDVVEKAIIEKINQHPTVIEEISPVERNLKNISLGEVWPDRAMAVSTKAYMEGDSAVAEFDVLPNKNGELLMSTINTAGGVDKVKFMPVGFGNVDENNKICDDYTFCYVTFKV